MTYQGRFHMVLFNEEELPEDKEHTLVTPPSFSSHQWYPEYIIYKTKGSNTGTATAPQSPSPSLDSQSSTQSLNTDAIVGEVIGGLFLITFIALGSISVKQRHRKQKSTASEVAFRSRNIAYTRSIRSVRPTSGTTSGIGAPQTGLSTPSGILKNGVSSPATIEPLRIRISDTT